MTWCGRTPRGTLDGRADGVRRRRRHAVPDRLDHQDVRGGRASCGCATRGGSTSTTGSSDHVPGSAFGRATIAQLLTHTSGLQSETDGPWWERTPGGDWAALMAPSPVQRMRAASRYHYTNVGYAALGELVARARGFAVGGRRPGATCCDPLGMTRTTTRPAGKAAVGQAVHPFADLLLTEPEHDAGAMAPAGQLWSTVVDLARWAAFLGGDTGDLPRDGHARGDVRRPGGQRPARPGVGVGARPGVAGLERRRAAVRRARRLDARLPRGAPGGRRDRRRRGDLQQHHQRAALVRS